MMWDTLVPPAPEQAARFRAEGWWRDETLLTDLARAAERFPARPAVIAYENGALARALTYAQLARMVARFAGALAGLGVGRGDVVVLYLPNRWMLAPLYLACMRAGAVAAPAIPALAGREMGHILRVSRAKVCVTVDACGGVDYAARVIQAAPGTLEHVVVVGTAIPAGAVDFGDFFVANRWEERQPGGTSPLGPDDPALLVFTSGTTGQPKAVVHSQNTIYAAGRSLSVPFGLTSAEVVSIPQYLTHVAAGIHAVFAPVTLAATGVTHDPNDDMAVLLDMVAAHQISYIHAAPAYLAGLLAEQRRCPRRVGSLRLLSSSSAPIPPQMVADAMEVFGLPLHAVWGMTETGGCTTTRPGDPPGWAAHSDGRPMPWMQVRIDAEPGAGFGRLLVRGASQCLGYLGQRETYENCLDDGWFDTGDMARSDGRGGIRITGRRADLITRATGAKVPTSEIEAILLRHPAVGEVVLIGYPDPGLPAGDNVCAVVVPCGEPPTLDDLVMYLDGEQVTSENWPDRVEIVTALPKNSLGKVLRPVLRETVEGRVMRPA